MRRQSLVGKERDAIAQPSARGQGKRAVAARLAIGRPRTRDAIRIRRGGHLEGGVSAAKRPSAREKRIGAYAKRNGLEPAGREAAGVGRLEGEGGTGNEQTLPLVDVGGVGADHEPSRNGAQRNDTVLLGVAPGVGDGTEAEADAFDFASGGIEEFDGRTAAIALTGGVLHLDVASGADDDLEAAPRIDGEAFA